jgi:hypothetical protein
MSSDTAHVELIQTIQKNYLPDPQRMIKNNTKTAWKQAILSYVDNGDGFSEYEA